MKEILLTSSVLIPVILLVRRLFRGKVSQLLIYAAWLAVLLRLLVPVQFGSFAFSLLRPAEPVAGAITELAASPVSGPAREEVYREVVLEHIRKGETVFVPEVQERVEQEAYQSGQSFAEVSGELQLAEAVLIPEVRQQVEREVEESITAPTVGQIAAGVWITGMAGMTAWFLWVNLSNSRRLCRDAKVLEGVDSPIPVRISPKAGSPCLVGLFRPVIYLTPESAADPETRKHVLTHELIHYRHLDHIWSTLRCVCLCVYWFDPLVWLAAFYSRRDCELACDEGALKKLGEGERIPYGKTLLEVVSHNTSSVRLMQTATSMHETKKQLAQRVNYIVKKPRVMLTAVVCMLLVCAITAGCVFTGAEPTEPATDETTPSGTESTEGTEAPTEPTDPTDVTAEPTEPPDMFSTYRWVPEKRAPLSYEELFSTEHEYEYLGADTSWVAMNGDTGARFTADLRLEGIVVSSWNYPGEHVVPNTDVLAACSMIAANGEYAYLKSQTQIIQVDMLTGEAVELVREGEIGDVYLCGNEVLYYSAVDEEADMIRIFRKYLPTGQVDALAEVDLRQTPDSWFYFYCPASSTGDLSWYMMNPEMCNKLKSEIADPNSKYRSDGQYDYSDWWENTDILDSFVFRDALEMICFHISQDTGINGFLKGSYSVTSGTYGPELEGIIDNCWLGSEYSHDHYDPVEYDIEIPAIPEAAPVPLSFAVDPNGPTAEEMYAGDVYGSGGWSAWIDHDGYAAGTLYSSENGVKRKVLDFPVVDSDCSDYYAYCITEDNTVIQVNPDGSFITTLYTAAYGELEDISYANGFLCFQDGNAIIRLDVPARTSQVVLRHDNIYRFNLEDGNSMFLELARGMTVEQYIVDFSTGELIPTRRL